MSKRKERALVSKTGSLKRLTIAAGINVRGAKVTRVSGDVVVEVTKIIEHMCSHLVRQLSIIAKNSDRSTVNEYMFSCALSVGDYNAILSTGFKVCKSKSDISQLIKQRTDHCLLLSKSGFERLVKSKLPRGLRIGSVALELLQSFIEQCVISYLSDGAKIAASSGKQTLSGTDVITAFKIKEGYDIP